MSAGANRGWGLVIASFLAAFALTIVPLPEAAEPFRPEWAALVLIYWCLALPTRVGVGIGWSAGLVIDVLQGTLLGQHALGFTMVAFITLKLHQRLRVHPLGQQAVSVLLLLSVNQLLVLWVHGMMGQPPTRWSYWMPSLTGALLWPATFLLLRRLRRRYRIG